LSSDCSKEIDRKKRARWKAAKIASLFGHLHDRRRAKKEGEKEVPSLLDCSVGKERRRGKKSGAGEQSHEKNKKKKEVPEKKRGRDKSTFLINLYITNQPNREEPSKKGN